MKRFAFPFILLLTIACIAINMADPFTIHFTLPNPFSKQPITINQAYKGIPFTKLIGRDLAIKKGLDLQGGTSITLKADMKDVPKSQRDAALDSAKSVIEKRINFFGVSEPVVQTSKVQNEYRVLVEIPGVTDVNQAVSLVGKTAKLTFWEGTGDGSEANDAAKVATQSAIQDLMAGRPMGITSLFGLHPHKTDLSGSDLKTATVQFSQQTGQPIVSLEFTASGVKKFADITKRNVNKVVAIALDEQVIEAPRVSTPILDGRAEISGSFTTETANNLVVQLNAGALPVSLSVMEQHAIGSTLGKASLEKSFIAGIIGFLVIIIFMIVLYGRLGIIASIALFIYSLLVLSLFRLIPVTVTLAGIAGFILSIGIAVDANILIFERMKEEIRRGRSLSNAIDLGFSRAWPSIRDSNVASLITSSVLFYLGTGVVRGFAVTLALGILVSMFSAIFVTRTLLQAFFKERRTK
jgi:preprotein translocase subunit SecD